MNLDFWLQLGYILVEQNIWWSKASLALSSEGRRYGFESYLAMIIISHYEENTCNADRCRKFYLQFQFQTCLNAEKFHAYSECLGFTNNGSLPKIREILHFEFQNASCIRTWSELVTRHQNTNWRSDLCVFWVGVVSIWDLFLYQWLISLMCISKLSPWFRDLVVLQSKRPVWHWS